MQFGGLRFECSMPVRGARARSMKTLYLTEARHSRPNCPLHPSPRLEPGSLQGLDRSHGCPPGRRRRRHDRGATDLWDGIDEAKAGKAGGEG